MPFQHHKGNRQNKINRSENKDWGCWRLRGSYNEKHIHNRRTKSTKKTTQATTNRVLGLLAMLREEKRVRSLSDILTTTDKAKLKRKNKHKRFRLLAMASADHTKIQGGLRRDSTHARNDQQCRQIEIINATVLPRGTVKRSRVWVGEKSNNGIRFNDQQQMMPSDTHFATWPNV